MFNLFEWDKKKAKSNKEKHGLSFPEATEIFKDPKRRTKQDTRHEYGEDRFVTVGKISKGLSSVVHTPRKDKTRLISARRANKKEKKWYQLF